MTREPRLVLELGALIMVWAVAFLGCRPGDTRHAAEAPSSTSEVERDAVDARPLKTPSAPTKRAAGQEPPGGSGPAVEPESERHSAQETSSPPPDPPDVAETESAAEPPAVDAAPAATEATPEGGVEEPELFADWPRPQLAFLLTGQQHGYIEPCGCTGLQNQKGGLARRHTLARQLRDRGWTLVPLDAGNQVRRVGRQAEIKFQMTLEGLKSIGYEALTLGTDDLLLSTGELFAAVLDLADADTPVISANVAILDRSLMPQYRVIEAAGLKVGVTAVVGDQWLEGLRGDEILREKVADVLPAVVEQLQAAECDLYVLLAHASIEESKALAEQYPTFQLVVTAGGVGDPTFQPERVGPHQAMFVQVGVKGMFSGVVGVFPEEPKLRYQRVPLDGRFEDSEQMLQLLAAYQAQLKELGLEGLGIKPLSHPSGAQFVGSQKCAECHATAFEIWSATPHAHATASLVEPGERTEIPRHFDPECLSCHVTGWHPQRFFPYVSGYLGLEETPRMHTNGCENCHGPGSEHVAAESGEIDLAEEALLARRAAMRLPLARAEQHCMQCHDLDNSPDFHEEGAFQRYWEEVEHYE